MIVTKGRRSFQQPNNNALRQINTSNYSDMNSKYFNRERHSLSAISPITKNKYNASTQQKRTNKKYDYSVDFQKCLDNSFEDNDHSYKAKIKANSHQKRLYQLKEPQIYKFRYDQSKKGPSKQISAKKNYNQKFFNDQKVSLQNYIKPPSATLYQRTVDSQKRKKSNKQNFEVQAVKQLKKDFAQKIFSTTDKFKQFSALDKTQMIEDSISKGKYQSKYSRFRNKCCQIIMKDQNIFNQNQLIQKQNDSKKQQRMSAKEQVNYEDLLKNTLSQNSKITERLNRIQKLNSQINQRLKKMLIRKNISS